jgi:hypothetical protein
MKKNETGPLSYAIDKKRLKMALEENIGGKFPDVDLGDGFLEMTAKYKQQKKNWTNGTISN